MDEALRERWTQLTALLGIEESDATRVLRDLWRRHDEPQRVYHRMSHVRHVLEVIDALRTEERVDDPVAVQLAAWFHDAVYTPGARDNEQLSAALITEVLAGWGIEAERTAHVARLVLATATHPVDGVDADTAVLVDADLAILAADPDTYDVYRRAIRVEHGHLDETTWRKGRGAFLAGMLQRPALYATASMRSRAEPVARRNMAGELAALDKP